MEDTLELSQEPHKEEAVTNMEADSQDKSHSVNFKRLAIKISAVFATCVQALIVIWLLCGAVQYYRHDITIVYAIKLLIKLFTISRATVYRTLFGVGASVMYIVLLAFMIKWLVISITRCIHIVIKKDGDACEIFGASSIIYDNCLSSLRFLIVLIVVAGLISPCEITEAVIAILVLVGIVFVLREIMIVLFDEKVQRKLIPALIIAAKDIFTFIAMCIIVAILNNESFMDLMYGLQKMFNGNVFTVEGGGEALVYSLYTDIVEPVLFIATAITFIVMLDEIIQPTVAYHFLTKHRIITSIVLTGVLTAGHLIFRILVINGSAFETYMIGEWLHAVSKIYLPLLFMLITLHIAFTALQVSINRRAVTAK
ncbi:MAG: hypothetical protein K2M89_02685 [Clostridiales bacterium]|nr:hypothetical protein [Clostridiales bacterium]